MDNLYDKALIASTKLTEAQRVKEYAKAFAIGTVPFFLLGILFGGF